MRAGQGLLAQMCKLLPDLLWRQDAPDGGPDGVWVALALAPLRVLPGGGGVGLVTLLTVVDNLLLARLLHPGRRLTAPAAFGAHSCLRSTVEGDVGCGWP